jgi:hypothetical protein
MVCTAYDLECLCDKLLKCFQECNLNNVDKIIKGRISIAICSKISVSLNKGSQLGIRVIELMSFMLNNSLVDPIFLELFQDQINRYTNNIQNFHNKSFKITDDDKFSDSSLMGQALKETLDRLFNINDKAEKYTKKNFGCSVLDLKGNFVWADEKTMTLLHFKEKDLNRNIKDKRKDLDCQSQPERYINLFDLMIPVSKYFIKKKFSEEMFSNDVKIGASKSFSYVIYNENNITKCLKTVKEVNFNLVWHERSFKI